MVSRSPHVHVCRRELNPNEARAKTKYPWPVEDGIVRGGLIKRVSVFKPAARAIDGLKKALAGLDLLDEACALDLRRLQDYHQRI